MPLPDHQSAGSLRRCMKTCPWNIEGVLPRNLSWGRPNDLPVHPARWIARLDDVGGKA